MQTELRSKLSDCFARLEILETNARINRQKIEAMALAMGKLTPNLQPQVAALFKPKE